jgi:hypothetical protein
MKRALCMISMLVIFNTSLQAQVKRRNQVSIGSTYHTFFDGQWSMLPSMNIQRYGFPLPPLDYRLRLNKRLIVGCKFVQHTRDAPPKYFENTKFPATQKRTAIQFQTTIGSPFSLPQKWEAIISAGVAYQKNRKDVLLGIYTHAGGWNEGLRNVGIKKILALPVELLIQRQFLNRVNLGVSVNYTYSLNDYTYEKWIVYDAPPERHSVLTSCFVSIEFGRKVE